MVKGLDKFAAHFKDYAGHYVIIGGTACDIIIEDAGFTPRATKDIDIILVVEALSKEFVAHFWEFIKEGKYEQKEKSEGERKYYRFMRPENPVFPFQLELFSRNLEGISLDDGAYLTPIPIDEDLSSLSAILMSEDYYNYIIDHSKEEENGLHHANVEALICLKAKAYLEIVERIANGSKEDTKQLRKHKTDVFRLAVMLAENDVFELPTNIYNDLQAFAKAIENDIPDKAMYKEMGLSNINSQKVFDQLLRSFKLTI